MVGSRGMKLLQRRSQNNYTTGRGKKPVKLSDFKTVWSIKKQDLDMKERLSKIKLLDSLIGKQGPLADYEEALKKKLVDELMSN
ncbi:hypothetical protein F2Q70_00020711 [Brassica cretica]|uniref:Uncharacterized protein n=1 Tax=Brassica cretica TaxID=69181 RepID=A0A8S9GN83_BRACR|nr:hypothetical protein F2Q70_00020711 [Brassica cretica]